MEAAKRELRPSISPSALGSPFRSSVTGIYDRLFLAMALHRSNGAEEAKELLEAAIDQLEAYRQEQSSFPTSLAIDPWQQRELSLLRTEAEVLIKPKR
jgi:hypothetical protein